MSRWEADGRGRLERAALALYGERGFDHTTVAEIAERAGVTERTFFRHFADKREVLFPPEGSRHLRDLLVGAVADAPVSLAPIDAVAAGLEAVSAPLQERRAIARHRAAIIAATPELRERELIKLAAWSTALAEALQRRGLDEPAARLTAEVAIAVFRIAFARWVEDTGDRDLSRFIGESLDQLKALTAGT
jgi:AcrR family transcriptional regulator